MILLGLYSIYDAYILLVELPTSFGDA